MNKAREFLLKYPQLALVAIISLVYLYFQLDMMLRTTGDEKTYVAQALGIGMGIGFYRLFLMNQIITKGLFIFFL